MHKYENGLMALVYGAGLLIFHDAQMFLTAPLWIGFTISIALQSIDIIKMIRGE